MAAPVQAPTLFGKALKARVSAGRSDAAVSFLDWSLRVPEPKMGRLSFEDYPFQLELYAEGADADDVAIVKPTQVGISAFLLRWVMYWPDQQGRTGLYVFPKRKQMYDFASARIDAAISRSEHLTGRVGTVLDSKGTNNKGLKKVGSGWVYFRGSESEDDLDSVDADVLALDEYDRLKQVNVPVAERRISGEFSLGLIRRVGVPSVPNFGIHRKYAGSDRRRWLVKCRCAEEQPLTWEDNVDRERLLRVCRACKRELRAQDVAAGRWAAESPGQHRRGYHLSKLVMPNVDVRSLVERWGNDEPAEVKAFWNRDMGEPFVEEEGRLSPEAIAAAMSLGERHGARGASGRDLGYVGLHAVTMGVDVASSRNLHVRISEHVDPERKIRRCLFVGEVKSFDDVAEMMDRFQVSMCAIDHLPEGRLARALAERYSGRVYLVSQSTSQQSQALVVHEDRRLVSVRRVEAIDATFEAVRRQRNMLPPDAPPSYATHLGNLVRDVDKGDDGRVRVRYVSVGPDDYAFAEMYDMVASDLWVRRQAVEALTGEQITVLEDHMLEFERTALGSDEVVAQYEEGPPATEYEDEVDVVYEDDWDY